MERAEATTSGWNTVSRWSNIFKTSWNMVKYGEIWWNMVKHGEIWWNMVKYDVYPILIPHSNLIIYSVSKKKIPILTNWCRILSIYSSWSLQHAEIWWNKQLWGSRCLKDSCKRVYVLCVDVCFLFMYFKTTDGWSSMELDTAATATLRRKWSRGTIARVSPNPLRTFNSLFVHRPRLRCSFRPYSHTMGFFGPNPWLERRINHLGWGTWADFRRNLLA